MQSPSKYDHHRRWRGHGAALALLWLSASLAGAAEFDARLAAPRIESVAELRGQAQSFAARFVALQAESPDAAVTNAAAFRERFDLAWRIQQAIDGREALGDLSAIGLVSMQGGAYRLDFAQAPQWMRLDRWLADTLPQADWDHLGSQLIARGFRTEDVSTLRNFVESHDASAAARMQALPVSLTFSRLVKKYDRLRIPVTDELVLSYLYQRTRSHDEALRGWAQQLFSALDAQRTRILISYYLETPGFGVWAPGDRQAGIADVLATVRLPNFEKLATDEAKGITP